MFANMNPTSVLQQERDYMDDQDSIKGPGSQRYAAALKVKRKKQSTVMMILWLQQQLWFQSHHQLCRNKQPRHDSLNVNSARHQCLGISGAGTSCCCSGAGCLGKQQFVRCSIWLWCSGGVRRGEDCKTVKPDLAWWHLSFHTTQGQSGESCASKQCIVSKGDYHPS